MEDIQHMRVSICSDGAVPSMADFWSSTPGVRAVDMISQVSDLSAAMATADPPDVIIARMPRGEVENTELLAGIQRISLGSTPGIAWVSETSPSEAFRLCTLGADEFITDEASIEERASMLAKV